MSASNRRRSASRRQNSESSNSSELEVNTDANFYPTVFGLVAFGALNVAISSPGFLPTHVGGALLLLAAIFALQFFHIYGHHFSRDAHVFYDEANILATNDAFECYDGAVVDDATPGGGCCGPYPIMGPQDSFYVQHYGNMMPNAKRFEAEWREADRKRMELKAKEKKAS